MESPKTTSPELPLTPCIGVCQLEADGLCRGCDRSLDEIAAWSSMDEATRRAVMEQLPLRVRTAR